MNLKIKFNAALFYRMSADIGILLLAFCISTFLLSLLDLVIFNNIAHSVSEIKGVLTLLPLFIAFVPFAIIIFSSFGFYTKGRYYQGRYKAIVLFQASSIFFLSWACFLFLFPKVNVFPKELILIDWIVTTSFLLISRLWSVIWKNMQRIESIVEPPVMDDNLILLIGGAGYIGSALLPKLLNNGFRVRLLDLFMYGMAPIENYLSHPNLEIIKADFRHVDEIVKAARGASTAMHLGAIVGDPACSLDEDLTIEVNAMATKMIAEVCKGCGVKRFIFASTCSVYGESDEVLDEKSQLNPVSLYAKSKIVSENILQAMVSEKFSPVCLRFGTIYGLSGRTRFDLVVNLLSAKAKCSGEITLYGGDQWRPFLHVDDAAEALFLALKSKTAVIHNEIFNVGSDNQNCTLLTVAEKINSKLPESKILELGQDGDRRNYRVNFEKIERVLGFKAEKSIEFGIDQVINAIESGKVTDYTDISYSNAKFLINEAQDFMHDMHYNVRSKVAAI